MREFELRYFVLNFLPREFDDIGAERATLRSAGRRAAVLSPEPWCAWLSIAGALWLTMGAALASAWPAGVVPAPVAALVWLGATAACLLVTWPLYICVAADIAHARIAALLDDLALDVCRDCGHLVRQGGCSPVCVECGHREAGGSMEGSVVEPPQSGARSQAQSGAQSEA